MLISDTISLILQQLMRLSQFCFGKIFNVIFLSMKRFTVVNKIHTVLWKLRKDTTMIMELFTLSFHSLSILTSRSPFFILIVTVNIIKLFFLFFWLYEKAFGQFAILGFEYLAKLYSSRFIWSLCVRDVLVKGNNNSMIDIFKKFKS